MRKLIPYLAPTSDPAFGVDISAGPPIRSYLVAGAILVAIMFGGFGTWAALAPLTSAAIAPGVVKVDSNRKTIQHLEGGIIREILVHEGDAVTQGQVLVRLDDVDSVADLNAIRAQISAAEAELDVNRQQLPTVEEELNDVQSLFQKGFAKKPQLLELERAVTKLKGDIAAGESRIEGLHEEERKAQAKSGRGEVTAPQGGVIMNLRYHSPGGVIPPGGAILDLVPDRDKLVFEAKIRPLDIDVVRPDLPATVRFVAYKQRITPTVDGKVTRVSADAITEERTGASYFLATIEVAADQLSRVPNVKLYPGMPVEATIVTGRRTMLSYLFQPFMDSFSHAFHED